MNKSTIPNNPQNAITTNLNGVMELLGVGKSTAIKIGKESGALVKLSTRRNLYKVDVLKAYIDNL